MGRKEKSRTDSLECATGSDLAPYLNKHTVGVKKQDNN